MLLTIVNRLARRLDPGWSWCGGCSDPTCDDCATEWRGRVSVSVEELAKDMFVRACSTYRTPRQVESVWLTEPEVRAYWIAEATEIFKLMGLV